MRLSRIDIYPVKSLHGVETDQAEVEAPGLQHDRRWIIVDAAGRFVTQRDRPMLATLHARSSPEGLYMTHGASHLHVPAPCPGADTMTVTIFGDRVLAERADASAGQWLGDRLGFACSLAYMADPAIRAVDPAYGNGADRVSFADGFPILLTNTASLVELNTRLARQIPMQRFRPNLTVDLAEPWAEDGWRRLRIGDVVLKLVKPCGRCLVTTIDQETGKRLDPAEPLLTLATYRRHEALNGVMFGQNAIPERLGTIRRGDPVEVLD
jgi:uncharacterized protein YcbX